MTKTPALGTVESAFIEPAPTATQRTRSRLKDFGPRFSVLARQNFAGPGPLQDRACVLVLAAGLHHWLGWLPLEEVLLHPAPPPSRPGAPSAPGSPAE